MNTAPRSMPSVGVVILRTCEDSDDRSSMNMSPSSHKGDGIMETPFDKTRWAETPAPDVEN